MPSIPLTAAPLFFQVGAVVLGAPCVVLLSLYVVARFRAARTPPASIASSVPNPDALLMILSGMERTIGAVAGLVGGLGRVFLEALAVVSATGLLLALGLWWTGHGLAVDAPWARPVALVATGCVIVFAGLAVLSRIGWWRAVAGAVCVVAAALAQSLWRG